VLGHDIGLHHNSLAVFLKTGVPPKETIERSLKMLRRTGDVTRTVGARRPLVLQARRVAALRELRVLLSSIRRRTSAAPMGWKFERVSAKELGVVESYFDETGLYVSDSAGSFRHWAAVGGRARARSSASAGRCTRVCRRRFRAGVTTLLTHPCYWRAAVKTFTFHDMKKMIDEIVRRRTLGRLARCREWDVGPDVREHRQGDPAPASARRVGQLGVRASSARRSW